MSWEGDTEVLIESDYGRAPHRWDHNGRFVRIMSTKYVCVGVKLGSDGGDPWSTDPNMMLRAKCAHCSERFAFPRPLASQSLVKCPYCKKVSFQGAKVKRSEMLALKVVAILFILAGIGLMIAVPFGGIIAGDKVFNFIFGGCCMGVVVLMLPIGLFCHTRPVSETTTAGGDIPEEFQ